MELGDAFKRTLVAGVLREVKKGKHTRRNKPKGQFSSGSPSFEVGKRYFRDIGAITSSTSKKEIRELTEEQTTAFLGFESVEVNYCGNVRTLGGIAPKAGSMKTKAVFDKFTIVIEHNMITCKFVTMAHNYRGQGIRREYERIRPSDLRASTNPY